MHDSSGRRSITDSPWYWVYLFATAGLIALLLAGPKYAARQAQIERNHEARLRAARLAAGSQVEPAQSSSDQTMRITLWPLYVVLGGLLSIAWVNLWRRHRMARRKQMPAATSNEVPP